MPVLRARAEAGEREISFTPGLSLLDLLSAAGLPVRSGCGGLGDCGLCLVRIKAGEVAPPTENELRKLRPEQIRQGIRLACQVVPSQDLTLTTVAPSLPPVWRRIPAADFYSDIPPFPERPRESRGPLGVAVDLGTTHVRVTLWDLERRVRLSGRSGLNPQVCYGSDVMTRLMAACASREEAAKIGRAARSAIGEALYDMAAGEGCRLAEVGRVVVVGNSAMLALLAGKNYDLLLKPAYWAREIDCLPEETESWCDLWGAGPSARVEVVQPLAGFVGSDLLAGVLATRLTEKPEGALLIDFGTNSEIALWDGKRLWVTSAAGGPAFEGCGIRCGMPAEPGAIFRVESTGSSPELRCEVIGGGEARGICGSGLVDLIASLRNGGILSEPGRFTRDVGEKGLAILQGRGDLSLTKRDVDGFQRAKAAIGAGTKHLMARAGMGPGDLRRVCVCGAFGRFLNVSNACALGLLPDLPAAKVELCGNTALAGCEILLVSGERDGALDALRRKARTINLAGAPEFEELFVENLYLRPLRMDA